MMRGLTLRSISGVILAAMVAACSPATPRNQITSDGSGGEFVQDGSSPGGDIRDDLRMDVDTNAVMDTTADRSGSTTCNPSNAPVCVTSCTTYLLVKAICTNGRWSCGPNHVNKTTCSAPHHASSVDPFIGTGGFYWTQGMLFPGATVPFGLVRLSPDMCLPGGILPGNAATAGYHDTFDYTWGFSHTRLSGTGAADGGLFRVTPSTTWPIPAFRSYAPLRVDHSSEKASPGYYTVRLPDIHVQAEVTATEHVGAHRYRFAPGSDAFIIVDVSSHLTKQSTHEGSVQIDAPAREVSGTILLKGGMSGQYGGLRAYFVAHFDQAFVDFGTWDGNLAKGGVAQATGDNIGAFFKFKKGATVEVQIGLSYVSVANARQNLKDEAGGKTFATLRAAAGKRWNDDLLHVHINTSNANVRKIFYTALYHALIMPTNFTDTNGEYLGFNGKIGKANGFTYRTDFSLWDTVRTLHPLLILAYPKIQRDVLKSLVRMARLGGRLPRWPEGGGYTGRMFGTPGDVMIAESYLKGITNFEATEAFDFMKTAALKDPPSNAPGRDGNLLCIKYGYCPSDLMTKSVAATLEYAWADGAIAKFAHALNRPADAAVFTKRAQAYRGTWNPKTRYFQPRRADGTFVEPLLTEMTTYEANALGQYFPKLLMDDYVEGSPQQWRWSVQHDPQGLIGLFGGAKPFVVALEAFMSQSSHDLGAFYPGPAYWHGNEHDFHAPYLFNEAGRPDLTQKWVRWVLTKRYGTGHGDLDGCDDAGTLSAWYVLSALGIYPIAGSANYWIGAPIVESAQIVFDGEIIVTIIAENQSMKNPYVQELFVNGVRHCKPIITHAELKGSTLRFRMGPSPGVKGGFDCASSARPVRPNNRTYVREAARRETRADNKRSVPLLNLRA